MVGEFVPEFKHHLLRFHVSRHITFSLSVFMFDLFESCVSASQEIFLSSMSEDARHKAVIKLAELFARPAGENIQPKYELAGIWACQLADLLIKVRNVETRSLITSQIFIP